MTNKTCSVTGCSGIVHAKGWCNKHYVRFLRHGDVLFTRANDWGCREKHPLYSIWHGMRRYAGQHGLDKRWENLWNFIEDIGEKPEGDFILSRKDQDKPHGPDNWYWKDKYINSIGKRLSKTEYARKWQKEKRATDPEFSFKQSLKKHYGITVEDYYAMHDEQGGVCKICNGKETMVDYRSQKLRRLTVDHCHDTKEVRGLLCSSCNRGLGSFKDDIDTLQNALHYLTNRY